MVERGTGTPSYVACNYKHYTRDPYTEHNELTYCMVTENLVEGAVGEGGEGVEVTIFPDPLCYKSLRHSRIWGVSKLENMQLASGAVQLAI